MPGAPGPAPAADAGIASSRPSTAVAEAITLVRTGVLQCGDGWQVHGDPRKTHRAQPPRTPLLSQNLHRAQHNGRKPASPRPPVSPAGAPRLTRAPPSSGFPADSAGKGG